MLIALIIFAYIIIGVIIFGGIYVYDLKTKGQYKVENYYEYGETFVKCIFIWPILLLMFLFQLTYDLITKLSTKIYYKYLKNTHEL